MPPLIKGTPGTKKHRRNQRDHRRGCMRHPRQQTRQYGSNKGDAKKRQVHVEISSDEQAPEDKDDLGRYETADPTHRVSPVDDTKARAGAPGGYGLEGDIMERRRIADFTQRAV